jgi:hypothetical protein
LVRALLLRLAQVPSKPGSLIHGAIAVMKEVGIDISSQTPKNNRRITHEQYGHDYHALRKI